VPIDLERVRSALASHRALSVDAAQSTARAAVAAVLRDGDSGAEVLLIRRAARHGDPWSGHMAFPGGRQQPDDRDILSTAMRETLEEVGLDLSARGTLLGRLDEIQAIARGRPAGLTVSPFVFALESPTSLVTNAEVEEVVWAPLTPIARGERSTTIPYELDGRRYDLPAWDVQGRIVWGLTYRMLETLLEVLGAPA